jgi:hypothetical protein
MRTKTMKKTVRKPVPTTKLKSVVVPLNPTLNLTATQETTVLGTGTNKVVTNGPVRFAVTDTKGNLVDTIVKKNLPLEKFNKKTVKAVAPSVLPVIKKMVKTGTLAL